MRNLRLLFLVGLATLFVSEKFFVSSQSLFSTGDDLYLEGQTSGDVPIDDEDGEDDGSGSGFGVDRSSNLDEEEFVRKFLNFSRTTVSNDMVTSPPQPPADSPDSPPTTAADSQHPPTKVKDTEITLFISSDGDNKDEEVAGMGPTADWFTQSISLGSTSKPPSETTATKDADEDNSLDKWDVSTPTDSGDEVQIKEVDNNILAKDGRGSRRFEMDSPEEVTSENLWERTEVLAAVIACGVVGFLCAVSLLLLFTYRMKKKDEGSYELGDTKLSSTTYHKAPTKEFYA